MSCPHLSRVAALRKSSHPDWFPTMILWVYDTKPEDYLPYLCGLNYTNREIEVILQHKVACNFSSHISALPASRLSEFWVFRLCIMLRLQLGIRQTVEFDSPFAKEYDEMQYILRGFYSKTCNEETVRRDIRRRSSRSDASAPLRAAVLGEFEAVLVHTFLLFLLTPFRTIVMLFGSFHGILRRSPDAVENFEVEKNISWVNPDPKLPPAPVSPEMMPKDRREMKVSVRQVLAEGEDQNSHHHMKPSRNEESDPPGAERGCPGSPDYVIKNRH
nr:subtilisin-like protease SBT1.7 [Ipomoea batatas]